MNRDFFCNLRYSLYNTRMKKFLKRTVPVFLALILTFIPTTVVFAEEEPATTEETTTSAPETTAASSDDYYNHVWPAPPEVESEAAFIMENSTSTVLYEKEADAQRYPASTTKILTALVAIENSSLDEVVTFSENAVNLEEAAVTINAEAGEQMTMKDVLYGLLIQSGNDCAVAIAEHIAGSVEAYAEMMNERAAEIGCTNTHFTNPHGLFDKNHYTSSRDLALMAQEAFKNSTFVEIMSTETYTTAPTNMDPDGKKFKHWDLLMDPESEYYDPDVIGGKTGFLDESGRCLVSFASRDGFTVICVQMKGAYTGIFEEAKRLLDYTFNSFSMKNVSANERRFSGAVEGAKVVLDPASQILTLNAIPFDQLESEMVFADDMDLELKAELQAEATENGRTLYGVINYRYADHDLGSAAIYLDPELEIAPAAFTQVHYISPLYLVLFVLFVLILVLVFYGSNKNKKKKTVPQRRPSSGSYRSRTR